MGDPGFESQQGQEIYLFSKTVQTGSRAQRASYSRGTGVFSRVVKRPRREVDHSPPSSAEVKNEWRDTSTPPICLHLYLLRNGIMVKVMLPRILGNEHVESFLTFWI